MTFNKKDPIKVLFHACKSDDIETVKSFHDFKVSDDRGYTPLHIAVSYTSIKVINFLLTQDIDIDAINDRHCTCIHFLHGKYPSVTKLLLEHGAVPNARSMFGTSLSDFLDMLNMPGFKCPDKVKMTIKLLIDDYIRYILTTRNILKYLGLENIYCIVRSIIEDEISDDQIISVVYK